MELDASFLWLLEAFSRHLNRFQVYRAFMALLECIQQIIREQFAKYCSD
jgi:hypothetical protein